jgi:hypothetical protein
VRFQAEQSNALWHFDMSPSDLKQLPKDPDGHDRRRRRPRRSRSMIEIEAVAVVNS